MARRYREVARHFGVSKRAVVDCAKRERWQQRVELIDQRAKENLEKKVAETLDQMNERHLKSLRIIQGKALESLRETPFFKTAIEAARALEMAIRQERVVRGEPSERTQLSIEETVRKEYDRWLSTDGEESHDDEDED